jgi:Serine/threonine protein kinase
MQADRCACAGDPGSFPIERYKLLKGLAKGEAGENYLCHDTVLDKKVVVKVLPPISAEQLIEFQRDATAICKLQHENIATPLDFGATASGAPYMVLDFYEGITLKTYIERSGALGLSAAVKVFIQLADALSLVHEHKLVHRDIKSSNLLLNVSNPDDIKLTLIDFGIAGVKAATQEPFIHQGQTVTGTLGYLPPEKVGGAYDERSEIYAAGCALFEALTGKLPFDGNTVDETITMHVRKGSPPLASVRYDMEFPPQLEGVVATCLAKNAGNRYQTMNDLKAELKKIEGQLRYAARMRNNASYAKLNAKYAEADKAADPAGPKAVGIDASKAEPLRRPSSLDAKAVAPAATTDEPLFGKDAPTSAPSPGTADSTSQKSASSKAFNASIVAAVAVFLVVCSLGAILIVGFDEKSPLAPLGKLFSDPNKFEGVVSYYKPAEGSGSAEFEILKPGSNLTKAEIVHFVVDQKAEIPGLPQVKNTADFIGQSWITHFNEVANDTKVLKSIENKTEKPKTELGQVIDRIQGMFAVMVGKPILVDATSIMPYYTREWTLNRCSLFVKTWERPDMLFKHIKKPTNAPISSFKIAAFDPEAQTATVLVKTDHWMQKERVRHTSDSS